MCEIIGLPIHNLILNGDDAPQIFVDKYVLLENKDKNKGNIESYANDPIPVTQYIPQYVKKLWELHNAVMNLLESALKLSFKQIEASIDEMKDLSKKEKLTHCDVISNKEGYIKTTLSKNIKKLIEHYGLYPKYRGTLIGL
ncbi:hypothetical protein [Legionella septentrionalis]|uniref:Uncharacterized protein n=1 Tax=Legionella septentrionalis TaxID=2498109 RepID=A0A433JJH5_9GAMM|nr:hypothetical protein [Legionella septentrionalis]RUQ88323.1 hypothetical protein EKM59_05475 [Legionella septentrionalis]